MTIAATRTALPLNPLVAQTTGLAMGLARQSRVLALATLAPQPYAATTAALPIAITTIPLERSPAVALAGAPKFRSGAGAAAAKGARPAVAADDPVGPRRTPQSDPLQHRSAPQAVTSAASTPKTIPAFVKAPIEEPLLTAAVPDAEAPLLPTARRNTSSQTSATAAAAQRAAAQTPAPAARQEEGVSAPTAGSRLQDRRSGDAPRDSRPRTPWQRLPRSLFQSMPRLVAIARGIERAARPLKRLALSARRIARDAATARDPITDGLRRELFSHDRAAPEMAAAAAAPATLLPQRALRHGGASAFSSSEDARAAAPDVAAIRAPSPWDPVSWTQAGAAVFGLSQAGGEAAPDESLFDEGLTLAERLTESLLSQLRAGPASLESGLFLARFNAGLQAGEERLSSDAWRQALRALLRIGVRHTPAFDEGGARLVSEIQADASRILGISPAAFIDWEGPLEFEAVLAQLFSGGRADDLAPELISGINEQVGFLAGLRIRTRWDEPAIPMAKDTALQWMIGRISNLDAGAKGAAARELIEELQANGSTALSARALSLILRNSALSARLRSDEGLVPRWKAKEAKALISSLMNDATWEVVSHRAFRRGLSDDEHLAINQLIEASNPMNILEAIGGIDVTTSPESVLWDAIEASGQAHAIFMDALQKMLMMSEKLRSDSNAASLRMDDLH